MLVFPGPNSNHPAHGAIGCGEKGSTWCDGLFEAIGFLSLNYGKGTFDREELACMLTAQAQPIETTKGLETCRKISNEIQEPNCSTIK